jgi:hypothetical protein
MKVPLTKNTVVMEIHLENAVIRPDKEKEFVTAFKGYGELLRQALSTKQGLVTRIEVSLK